MENLNMIKIDNNELVFILNQFIEQKIISFDYDFHDPEHDDLVNKIIDDIKAGIKHVVMYMDDDTMGPHVVICDWLVTFNTFALCNEVFNRLRNEYREAKLKRISK